MPMGQMKWVLRTLKEYTGISPSIIYVTNLAIHVTTGLSFQGLNTQLPTTNNRHPRSKSQHPTLSLISDHGNIFS